MCCIARSARAIRTALVRRTSNADCGSDRVHLLRQNGAPRHERKSMFGSGLILMSAVFAVLTCGLLAVSLLQLRDSVWAERSRGAENIARTLSSDIAHRIEMYGFVLKELAKRWTGPSAGASPHTEFEILQESPTVSDHLGSLVILGPSGEILADAGHSVPRQANFSDRDYFAVHRDGLVEGLYVSTPFRSRLRGGDPSIAFSMRLDGPDGHFAGVAVVTLSLTYFTEAISRIDVGDDGVVSITRSDGFMVARDPSHDGHGDVGLSIAGSTVFQRIVEEQSGTFVGRSQVDGVERLYAFDKVAGAPLYVSVGVAVKAIFDEWRSWAWLLGLLTIAVCTGGIVLALYTSREMKLRAESEAAFARLSLTDSLTGLANRRRFDEVLAREWRRTQRTSTPLALLIVDADHFKQLNDRFGHAYGDEALKMLAEVVTSCIRRPGDTASRIGGEEFAVILPDTDETGATNVADQICRKVDSTPFLTPEGLNGRLTVSIGVAAIVPDSVLTNEHLFAAADLALYRAKEGGRNRVALRVVR